MIRYEERNNQLKAVIIIFSSCFILGLVVMFTFLFEPMFVAKKPVEATAFMLLFFLSLGRIRKRANWVSLTGEKVK